MAGVCASQTKGGRPAYVVEVLLDWQKLCSAALYTSRYRRTLPMAPQGDFLMKIIDIPQTTLELLNTA